VTAINTGSSDITALSVIGHYVDNVQQKKLLSHKYFWSGGFHSFMDEKFKAGWETGEQLTIAAGGEHSTNVNVMDLSTPNPATCKTDDVTGEKTYVPFKELFSEEGGKKLGVLAFNSARKCLSRSLRIACVYIGLL
jgi:hypothetical protein